MGHKLYGQVAKLPFPTVALVDGNCMGGGTELILSMDDRIVSTGSQTKIALPEVKIGIIPGWGGTQRLPRLIGLNAIEIICTGEPVSAAKAVEIGLAFDAVPADRLVEEGVRLIDHHRKSGEWQREAQEAPGAARPEPRPAGLRLRDPPMGAIQMKTKGQYPAPLVALKAIRDGANLPLDEALKVEREASLEVMGSPISANLIAVFFMQNRLSRDAGIDRPDVTLHPIRRVGVIGSGLMGAGDRDGPRPIRNPVGHDRTSTTARLSDGLKRAAEVVTGRIKIGRATTEDLAKMLGLLSTSTSNQILADSDLVIEAITENEAAKAATYKELAKVLKDDAILREQHLDDLDHEARRGRHRIPSVSWACTSFNPVDTGWSWSR